MSASKTTKPIASKNCQDLKSYGFPAAKAPCDLILDFNEGQAPDVEILKHLATLDPKILSKYSKATELEALLAEEFGLEKEQVLITAGGDDSIDRICRSYLFPDREIVVAAPTFEMFNLFAKMTGGKSIHVPWPKGAFPTDQVLEKVNGNTGVIQVISPNNPTGAIATKEDLKRISEGAGQALVVMDAAYGSFTETDLTEYALTLDNVVVLQTFSKAWGMAGARLGFTMGPKEIIDNLRNIGLVFPVSSLSVQAGIYWRKAGVDFVENYVKRVRLEREDLYRRLKHLGGKPLATESNFIFSHFKDPLWVRDALAGMGIAIRLIPSNLNFEKGIRITCPGDKQDYIRLCAAFETILDPECILFDMDGVLVDVSASYREAIRLTAKSYGVILQAEEIAKAKAEEGANNDWVVTQRLLERKGVKADLAEVTAHFEKMYHGTEEHPGLYTKETLRIDKKILDLLAERFSLGIVTGRPRRDAERFLKISGIENYFQAVICQEDAPQKPDPAPVTLAMKKMGVDRAWMIGDAPDDIAAARAASVLPIGMIAPGDCETDVEDALYLKGAARVIKEFDELKELLS